MASASSSIWSGPTIWMPTSLCCAAGGDIDIRQLMGRRLRLIGSVLRSRPLAEKVAIRDGFMTDFWPAVERGDVQPVIDSVFPIMLANDAHKRMQDNKNTGKIVLQV